MDQLNPVLSYLDQAILKVHAIAASMTPWQRARWQLRRRKSWTIGELMRENSNLTYSQAVAMYERCTKELI